MAPIQYPPPPWLLKGKGGLSVFSLPAHALSLPEGIRPISIAGRAIVGVLCIAYEAGGVLAYNELAVGVAVRTSAGWGVHISHIWVDSAVSATGGQELWAIPKQFATFTKSPSGVPTVQTDSVTIAQVRFQPHRPLPRRWKFRSRALQERGGRIVATKFRMCSHLALSRAEWQFSGPLSFLEGRHPLISIGLSRAELEFGLSA